MTSNRLVLVFLLVIGFFGGASVWSQNPIDNVTDIDPVSVVNTSIPPNSVVLSPSTTTNNTNQTTTVTDTDPNDLTTVGSITAPATPPTITENEDESGEGEAEPDITTTASSLEKLEDNKTEDYEEEEEEDEEEDVEEDSNSKNEDSPSDDEEDSYEEDRCTFNQFLAGLKLSHYLPEDRITLKSEYDSFQDVPEKIRHSPSVNYTVQRLKRLLNLASGLTRGRELRSGLASFLQHNYDLFLELELDAPCMTSIISIIAAIRRSELWAIKFVDSMAKPPSGLLSGVTSFLGDFDQCISVQSPETASEEFNGQYCLLRPVLPLPELKKYSGQSDENLIRETKILNYLATYQVDRYVKTNPVLKFIEHMQSVNGRVLNYALCVPDLCSPQQLEKSINKLLYPIVGIPFEIQNSSCWTMSKTKDFSTNLTKYSQFALVVLAVLISLVIVCTLHGLYYNSISPKQFNSNSMDTTANDKLSKTGAFQTINYLVCIFSAQFNTKRLLAPSRGRVAVFDTLRLMVVILIGLSNAFYNTPLTSALRKISQSVPYELLSDPRYFFIRAPSLLNDALLVIAGAVFVRSVFHHLDSPHDMFSCLLYLSRRWLRLTAPLFGSILFLFILPLTGYGPLWDRMVDIITPSCTSPSSLTSTLLYYSNWNFLKSNYSNSDAYVVCNPDTWFLSIIFQLNIAFFIIVVLMYQSPRNGLRMLVLFTVSSLLLNISPKLLHSDTRTYYELTKQPSLWHLRRNFYLYHQNVIQYVGAFSVGVFLGYTLVVSHTKKHHPRSSRKTLVYNGLAISTIVGLFVWVNRFFVLNSSPDETSVLLFFSVGRLIFSIALAWIIYACATNKSPMLASFLSVSSLQPIARLSYSIFLVQSLVQYHRMYSVKDTYVMTFRGTIENYTIDFLISTLLAYLLYLLFEGPAQKLNELFCGKESFYEDNLNYKFCDEHKRHKSDSKKIPIAQYDHKTSSVNYYSTDSITYKNGTPQRTMDSDRSFKTNIDEYDDKNDVISIRF